MADTNKPSQPIMDVAHPNKSAPSPNSKSVIISHHPVMQDPMVSPDASADVQESVNSPAKKVTVQPLSAPLVPGTALQEKSEEIPVPAATSAVSKKIIQPMSEDHEEPVIEKPLQPSDKPQEDTKSIELAQEKYKDRGDAGVVTTEAVKDAAEAEKKKAEAELQKLIDSKQYYLPINTLEKRRTKRTIAIGVVISLLLIATWFGIALDAGLLTIDGVKPVTDFF